MARIIKREAAKRDLIERWVWYAENATIEIADRFLLAVDRTLSDLATHPLSGQIVLSRKPELKGTRRTFVRDGFDKTLIFYLPIEDGIDLVRVIHGNRNIANIL